MENKVSSKPIKTILVYLIMFFALSANALEAQSRAMAMGTYADFDESMGKGHFFLGQKYESCISSETDRVSLDIFRTLYKKNNLAYIIPSSTPKIPKIMHQIWLGSTVPEKFNRFTRSWKKLHPDWEYKLWTDDEIEKLNLKNYELYNAAVNYAERSDIARHEILYRFGGVYIDIDMECIKPIDILHHTYDFFAGIEPPAEAPFLGHLLIVSNAIIGAAPGHPIIKACIDSLESYKNENDIIFRTGPLFFTKIILNHLSSDKNEQFKNIVLPTSFLFPFGKKVKTEQDIAKCIKTETFAIHHWAGSWIFNPKAFIPGYSFKIKVTQK